MQAYESIETNGKAHDACDVADAMQCGVCLRYLPERHFRKLYVSEIPGYPLGAPLRTLARVLICKQCWNEARNRHSRAEVRLRKLVEWIRR